METGVLNQILLLALLIVINGIFSMTEMAVVSVRKARLQSMVEEGNPKAKKTMDLIENPNDFFSTIQIVITLVGIVTGAFGASAFSDDLAILLRRVEFLAPAADSIALVLVSIIITYFSLVIGELAPKRLATASPENISMRMAGLMIGLSKLSEPIVKLLSWSTEVVVHLLGVQDSGNLPVSEDEVKVMIEEGKKVGIFEEKEQDIVESVFRMSDRTVDAMMTPRTELTWIDIEEPLQESLNEILGSTDDFFPLVRDNADNILGVISAKHMLNAYIRQEAIDLEAIAETPLFIPESKPALDVLDDLRDSGKQVALVMDEYGGFSGMVTLVDILEEMVGDIPDSGTQDDPQIVLRTDGSWLLDGSLDVDELKDIFDIRELPEEDRIGYQTLGGFILSQLGHIPTTGEYFDWENLHFEVIDLDGHRIDKVLVSLNNLNNTEPGV